MMFRVPFFPAIDTNRPNLFQEETIASVVEYAQTQPPGIHKLQISNYPVSFAVIGVNAEKKVSMHVVNGSKDDNYPCNINESINLGYRWYLENRQNLSRTYSREQFAKLQKSTCTKIDSGIEGHHGIPCCIETGSPNHEPGGFILHFCDVLSIKLSMKQGIALPTVLLPTEAFSSVPANLVDSLFDTLISNDGSFFTEEERNFVFDNASLYYYIYGYWHNYSNKAIRCSFEAIQGIDRALVLARDDIFLRLQDAKQNALDRRAQGEMVRGLYLLD